MHAPTPSAELAHPPTSPFPPPPPIPVLIGFLSDDVSAILALCSVVLIIPTGLCLWWKPGWFVVASAVPSLVLGELLGVDAVMQAFDVDGSGRRTAIGAALYTIFAAASAAVGTLHEYGSKRCAKKRHVAIALGLTTAGGVASIWQLLVHLTESGDTSVPGPEHVCDAHGEICSVRFAVAVVLLWVSLASQVAIECCRKRLYAKPQVSWLIESGRVAGPHHPCECDHLL